MDLFSRQDWTLFRNLSTLGQRAGIGQDAIPQLVAKELVDNALDAAGTCRYGRTPDGGLYVEDDSDGLPGTDADVAALFSVARPLSSSKLLRLPTRGALGNGLRVVAGAVLASGGTLTVKTRGRALRLRPRDADGGTDVEHVEPWMGQGTRIEALLGEALPMNGHTTKWADQAAAMAAVDGQSYRGATSPWWYDSDSFYELTQAAGARPVRALVESFAGCSGARAGKLAADFTGRPCDSLTRGEAEMLLDAMRRVSRQIKPKRLGAVGPDWLPTAGYAREAGDFQIEPARGKLAAHIPVVVETWARPADAPTIVFYVNRTPITAEIHASRCMDDKAAYGLVGCGLSDEHKNTACPVKVGRGREYLLVVNVTTPYMPITTDGKAPDLSVIEGTIRQAIEKAIRRAKRKNGSASGNGRQTTQAAVIIGAIPAAMDMASGNGQYRYNLRNLFYAVRPHVLNALGIEPDYNYFAKVVTDYEGNQGHDLPGMYRDDRGTLYHPHTGETIPLGTRSVEAYQRPAWTFNKILYCEKEGFFPILIDAQWPERHDCALLTSKGYASRAARDVLDLLGDGDEPLTFYCIHDADAAGTMIYQTLQEGTRARPGRRVEIVNLGLDPAEALDMGLPAEAIEGKGRRPVAAYIGEPWRKWLQGHRVELNAMTTPRFLAWLDGKMQEASGKLIPPPAVVADRLRDETHAIIRRRLVDDALLSARIEERTAEALDGLGAKLRRAQARLLAGIGKKLADDPALPWTSPVAEAAAKVASKTKQNGTGRPPR